jgi:nucleoid-associated protein YgaU
MPIEREGPAMKPTEEPVPVETMAPEGAAPAPVTAEETMRPVREQPILDEAPVEARVSSEAADMADFKRQLRDIAAAKTAARTYTVQPGDSLSAIARETLGDASRWPEIFEVNRDKLDNPDVIFPGQELTIPSRL